MPGFSNPRIKRGSGHSDRLTDRNVREKAWDFLLGDFKRRCAYTMRHLWQDPESQMEIDHFDPTLNGAARNEYSNLMLATAHCNNFKREKWPHKVLRDQGFRFLNPTLEQDYEEHLFEDPETHELVTTTPTGRYHIDMLDLNNKAFVRERKARAEFRKLKKMLPTLGLNPSQLTEMTRALHGVRFMIPPIAPPPPDAELI